MQQIVLDGANTPVSTLARLKLAAELTGLLKRKAILPVGPAGAIQGIRIAADIVRVLRDLGVNPGAKQDEAQRAGKAFELEGGPEPVAEPRQVTAKFFDFDPNRKTSARRRDNSAAMELLRKIDRGEVDGAALTDAQKATLALYSGTGGNLVGADGKKGSAYEYYTPKPIAQAMWGLLGELGFKGGKTLDPCSGVGIFGACAPENVAMESVELNETSGRINQLVNGGPGYNAIISPFEAVASRTPDETYDAVVSNVPFGSMHDRGSNRKLDDRYQDETLEAYFILRSLEKLKPGGMAAFIVPPRVVSAKGGREEKLRIALSYMAEFMGAYRLPNSVFGTADADTITDVIVLRKYGRPALDKIAELREQNPAVLVKANVQWTEFIAGNYFAGEGRRFVLGEFQAKDPNKFRDVDRVINNNSVADIAKLMRKFPGSRVDWALLDATETQPISYNEGDTITMAGQTLEMRDGRWVAVGKANEDSRFDGLGEVMGTPTQAAINKVTWQQASDFADHLERRSMALDMPDWLRGARADMLKVPDGDRAGMWTALLVGLAVVEVTQAHGGEVGFNYDEAYPALSEGMQAVAPTAKRGFAQFGPISKAALRKVGILYSRKDGFSVVWTGEVAKDVMAGVELTEDAKIDAIKYNTQGIRIPVEALKEVYGADFDPLTDDEWCLSGDGKTAIKADDYYSGNLGEFLARIDEEIAAAGEPLRSKLLRQKAAARDRVDVVDPQSLRYNLFSPFATIEEKAEFLRRFMHPAFVVAHDDEGQKVIICDISSPKNERERQLKRFAEYLKKGNLSTRTSEAEARANPLLEEARRKMLREMAATANAQFDQWTKANPAIMGRLRETANDPARVYFREVDDYSPLKIEGMHPDWQLHGYQNAEIRKRARHFSGINGFGVGLGKTATAAACVLYVQSIGVKKKTMIVVPNAVLSNWRKELLLGEHEPGHPKYKPPVFSSGDDCLFVGLDVDEQSGKARVDSANYARDFTKVLTNRHRKIFCTLEAFKAIPLKDETVQAYESYLASVDPSFAGSDRNADTERAESKLVQATEGTGQKSSAIPFFEDMGVDSLVMDEAHCFPAGTMVDGVPIEALRIGDMVRSYNHETKRIELRRVTDVMSRVTPDMVRVHLKNGQSIVCTHNHPFYTESQGYLAAEFLSESDVVYINHSKAAQHDNVQVHALRDAVHPVGVAALQGEGEPGSEDLLRARVLREGINQEDPDRQFVRGVLDGVRAESHAELEVGDGTRVDVLLQPLVRIDQQAQNVGEATGLVIKRDHETGHEGCAEAEGKLASDAGGGREESTQEDFQRCAQGQGACAAGRERATVIGCTRGAGQCAGMANGVRGENEHAQGQRVSASVQTGSRSPDAEDRRGSRWPLASISGQAEPGCEEGSHLVPVGVDRVEVLERSGDDEFGGLCPGGLVYDITVDGNHNFFAEGILVHNCFKNSKNTVEFGGAKFLSVAEASQRGLDVQMKAWFVRGLSPLGDGVLPLTATPITNSPLEIYSMLCLAVGERRVHDLTMGARGADEFMDVMCDIVEDEEEGIDGITRTYRVFRGLQNVNLLRQALSSVVTIRTAAEVKLADDALRIPDGRPQQTAVQLTGKARATLSEYQMAYRGAREFLKGANGNVQPEELEAMERVAAKFGEPVELIAHPFNLINKMTMVIADPELDERATFYTVSDAAKAQSVVDQFNKLGKVEVRRIAGPWTSDGAVIGAKVVRDGDSQVEMLRIKVQAAITKDGRVVIDTMDTNLQADFERLAEKAGLDLDVSIPPKLAAMLDNVRKEEAHPRSQSGRVKQLIFCDILPLHNKIKRALVKSAGVSAAAIIVVSGQTIKNPEQMQGVQDGFNADGEDNKYRYVVANEKAEVGINLQKGTQAIHHLTIGWTPDSTIQRDGRGVRQGNTTGYVNVYHYDADGTFDSYKRNLTSKKADWIGQVMDRNGGNEVAVAGGLTREQYDELIESMGDENAIAAIQERAALREKAARAETARGRQVINLKTAQAQAEFQRKYPSAKEWIVDKAMQLYDLRATLRAMEQRAQDGKGSATSQVKLQARIAEVQARVAGMVREIDDSARFVGEYYQHRGLDRPLSDVGIEAMLDAKTGYSVASKVREAIVNRLKGREALHVKDGSALEQEWQAEVDQAKAMEEEALRDFERIAAGPDSAYPQELIKAFRDGQLRFIDGQPIARGMFARGPKGLLVAKDTTWLTRYPDDSVAAVVDVVNKPDVWKLIMFGTPEYEDALREAAQFDDQAEDVTPFTRPRLFGEIVPAVNQYRKVTTQVSYDWEKVQLPAPGHRFPVFAGDDASPALKAIAAQSPVREWDGSRVIIDATVDLKYGSYSSNSVDAARLRLNTLLELAAARNTPLTVSDYAYGARGPYALRDNWGSSAANGIMEFARRRSWPAGLDVNILNAPDEEAAAKLVDEAVRAVYAPFLVLPDDFKSLDWCSHYNIKGAYNERIRRLDLERKAKAAAEEAARLAAIRAANPAPMPVPEPEPTPAQQTASASASIRLQPWVSPKNGERRVYFNDVPKLKRSESAYAREQAGADSWTLQFHGTPDADTRHRVAMLVRDELAAMAGGNMPGSFAKLLELAGANPEPADPAAQGGTDVGISGNTKPNMGYIKAAAAAVGAAAKWDRNNTRWVVPAAAWEHLKANNPEAAKQLQAEPV